MTVPVYNMTDTWDDGGAGTTVFTAIGMSVTDTSSAATSKLIDLKVGGNSEFNVDKYGNIVTRNNGSNIKHLFGGIDLGGSINFFSNTGGTPCVVFNHNAPNNGDTICSIQFGPATGSVIGINAQGSASSQIQFVCYNTHANGSASFQVQNLPGSTLGQLFTTYDVPASATLAWSCGLNCSDGHFTISNAADLNSPFFQVLSAGNVKFNNAASFSANGAVATSLGSVGPTGAHTTVQKWLTIVDNGGVTGYIPVF